MPHIWLLFPMITIVLASRIPLTGIQGADAVTGTPDLPVGQVLNYSGFHNEAIRVVINSTDDSYWYVYVNDCPMRINKRPCTNHYIYNHEVSGEWKGGYDWIYWFSTNLGLGDRLGFRDAETTDETTLGVAGMSNREVWVALGRHLLGPSKVVDEKYYIDKTTGVLLKMERVGWGEAPLQLLQADPALATPADSLSWPGFEIGLVLFSLTCVTILSLYRKKKSD